MTSQEKKARLRRYREAELEAARLEEEIARWYSKAEQMTAMADKLPGGARGQSRVEVTVSEIDNLTALLADRRGESVRLRRQIEEAIASVPDGRLRQLLRFRYIEGMTWERIRVNMGFDDVRHIYRLHGKALEAISAMSLNVMLKV